MKSTTLVMVLTGLWLGLATTSYAQNSAQWQIQKTAWTAQDEKNFEAFVVRLGEKVAKRECNSVKNCMLSEANVYRNSDPAGLNYAADCADFPYFVRGYFAFKNRLPFSFANEMKPRPVAGNSSKDIRYSRLGNEPTSKFSVAATNGVFPNAVKILNQVIPWQTDSGNFRINYGGNDTGDLFVDFYPVKISRESVKPGTVLYDPNGHVALIYKVTDDGKAYYIDAHPDNSLTSGAFSIKFVRSHPGQGAGFKNWRPVKLVGATQNSQGYYVGGKIVGVPNSQIADYSVEQFFGSSQATGVEWTQAKYVIEGKAMVYHDYVRNRLAKGDLRLNPVDDYRSTLADLCLAVKDRVGAVDISIKAGIQNQPHPARLPENIYGTDGDWETYSTPSRDAQMKVSFRDLIDQADSYLKKLKVRDPQIVYSGNAAQLKRDLIDVYQKESQSCELAYVNSVGRSVSLNLEMVRQRLFAMSFDPYNCVELRWGASSADELSTCADNANKRLWYQRQQQLRNQHIRRYDIRMDFSVDDLARLQPGVGLEKPIDIDVVRFLESQ